MERAGVGYATVRGDQRVDAAGHDGLPPRPIENPLVPLRATTVNEALDLGFQLLRSRLSLLVGLTATLYLPIQLLDLVLRLTLADDAGRANQAAVVVGVAGVGGGSGWTLVPFLLQRVAQAMLGVSCGYLIMAMTRGEAPGYRSVLGFTLKRIWVAALIVVLVAMLVAVGGLLAIFGTLLFASWTFVASVVAGAERLGPFASVGRSISLSRANAGPALMMFIGVSVVTLLIRAITFVGPAILLNSLGMPEVVRVTVEQLSMLLLLVAPLLTSTLAATSYLSMRTRSEGLDIAYRISEGPQLNDR